LLLQPGHFPYFLVCKKIKNKKKERKEKRRKRRDLFPFTFILVDKNDVTAKMEKGASCN